MKHAYLIIPNRPGKYRVEWYTVDSEGRECSVPCTGVGSVPDKYSATRERPRYRLGSSDDLDYDIKALTEETSGYDIVVMLDGHHPNYYVRKVDGLFGNLEPWAKDADAWFCAENSVCDAIHHCVDNAMLDFKADHPELFHAD